MSRFPFGRIALLLVACTMATGLVLAPRPLPTTAAHTSHAPAVEVEVTPQVPHALGRTELTCDYVGTNSDDMLVRPGQPGTAHQHDYFGAHGVTAMTTVNTVRGNGTSCPGDDESTYWAPALLIGETTFRPTAKHIYYERNTTQPVTEFPPGFHMIVGDMHRNSGSTGNPHISFACAKSSIERVTRVSFPTCGADLEAGSKPRNTFVIYLEYPNCWDGRPATGPSMNLTYATGADAQCPPDFPVLLPTLRTQIWYDLPLGQTLEGIRLVNGPMGAAHANFVNGWSPEAMTAMVDCLNTDNRDCAVVTAPA